MSKGKHDVIVVGSGTSAYYAAEGLNEGGRDVAIVDERPYGGTCALRGCQPKKYLVCNVEAVAMASDLVDRGIVEAPRTDWVALQALKNDFLKGKPENQVKSWHEQGVTTYHGRARMTGERELAVGDEHLTADHIVLATGASPRCAAYRGSEHAVFSDDFLELDALPRRIVFVGGGYISFEFAHVAARAGAEEVTILQRSDRVLKGFDADMAQVLIEAGEKAGVRVVLEEPVEAIEKEGEAFRVIGGSGKAYATDLVVEATGRVPNLSVLEGGAGGVEHDKGGVVVNAHLRSVSNPAVYAIGDCVSASPMLAPVADAEGKLVARNILEGDVAEIDVSVVPSAAFTIPNIASVGLTEEQAAAKGLEFRVNRGSTTGWPSSKRIGEDHGAYKVLIEEESGRILGAHLVRHHAAEAINVFGLAMKHGITAGEMKEFLWAYPTLISDLKYMVG